MAGFGFGTLLIVLSALGGLTVVAVGWELLRRSARARDARRPVVVGKVVGPPVVGKVGGPPSGAPAAVPAPAKPVVPTVEAGLGDAAPPRPPRAPAFSTMRPIGSFGRRS